MLKISDSNISSLIRGTHSKSSFRIRVLLQHFFKGKSTPICSAKLVAKNLSTMTREKPTIIWFIIEAIFTPPRHFSFILHCWHNETSSPRLIADSRCPCKLCRYMYSDFILTPRIQVFKLLKCQTHPFLSLFSSFILFQLGDLLNTFSNTVIKHTIMSWASALDSSWKMGGMW